MFLIPTTPSTTLSAAILVGFGFYAPQLGNLFWPTTTCVPKREKT